MEKFKSAEVNDLVKVLTPDEHLIPMKILKIDHANCTVLLGRPKVKISALNIGESIILRDGTKFKSKDVVLVKLKNGKVLKMQFEGHISEHLIFKIK